MNTDEVQEFINQNNYDLRISGNGRWIDQKCTPDVLWSVSDFVLNYIDENATDEQDIDENAADGQDVIFGPTDIWQSDYALQTIKETYCKPGADDQHARNEYDKVFSQPLCLLCYAKVLEDTSNTSRHQYKVANRDVLEYIAKNDMNSYRFLCMYIEKVLSDSGLMDAFNSFFDSQQEPETGAVISQEKQKFKELKTTFIDFYHQYTKIEKDYEPKRIFTKVLNPLACRRGKKGTEHGHLSSMIIPRADLMYNRDNFRDVYADKPKGITRKDWLAMHPEIDRRDGYFEQMMNRASRTLRAFNDETRDGISELTMFINGQDDDVQATQIHHIFPKADFPDIKYYMENMIALTPNQHYGYAHPRNNTHAINLEAQKVLLDAKTYSIKQNLTEETEEPIYEFANLLIVLAIGWDDDDVLEIEDGDYADVLHSINYHYETA